jgi:hypothetical protein
MLIADNAPTFSGSIRERATTKITFTPKQLAPQPTEDLSARFKDGDPFWEIIGVIDAGVTSGVEPPKVEAAQTAARLEFNVSQYPIVSYCHLIPSMSWGKIQPDSPKNGDVSLILRMLPLTSNTDTKKRADCHLWPKGTFLQIDGKAVRLAQRKQQAHNEKLWKGMCKHLDITEHISHPEKLARIQLCCYDDQPYLYCLTVCEFRSVDKVFDTLMDPGQTWIEKLSREEGFRKAIQYVNANGQMVVLDSDNDESEKDAAKLIFSLICPISKAVMKTPVRGKNCKHWQVRITTGSCV